MIDFLVDYFVIWGVRYEDGGSVVVVGVFLFFIGKFLGKLNIDDLIVVIERGFKLYSKWLYFEFLVFLICILEVLINLKFFDY